MLDMLRTVIEHYGEIADIINKKKKLIPESNFFENWTWSRLENLGWWKF